jgi:DNA processing protein
LAPLSQEVGDAAGRTGPDVVAACALSAVPGLGASTLARIAEQFPSLRAAVEEGPRGLLEREEQLQLKAEARQYLAQGPNLRELGTWALQAARDAGARVVLFEDEEYPESLRAIPNPPRLLYVRGTLRAEARRIAVVGARDASEAGLRLAHGFGDAFARAGVEVVSGGARGIDAAAHEGALWAQGTSIAVLGCGIDVVYPWENRHLFARLANGGGAVISEFAPGTQPMPRNFPRRNRTVAGLSAAVVVVRAASRSGALITAEHAAAQGRRVFAVPGDPGNPLAAGSNALLLDRKADLAVDPRDVLTALDWPLPALAAGDDASHPAPPASHPESGKADTDTEIVDAAAVKLWRLLDETTPAHVDDLALRAQIPAGEALGKLAELELKGMVLQRPGKYFLRR